MTYPPPGAPMSQFPTTAPYPPAPKQKNTLGLIAIITAVAGFVFACIPGALIVGWILLPIAFILGIVGLCQTGKAKGTSIAAVVVAIVGTMVGFVVFFTVVTDAVDEAFGDAFSGSTLSAVEPVAGGDASAGGRENPLPIGQSVANAEWEIVLGAPREAGAEVSAENQFNDAPKAGMEYWIVPVSATYTGSTTGTAWIDVSLKFVGSDNRAYSDSCGVIPDALSDVDEVYPGGVAAGNECVAVPAGADGLWAVTTGFSSTPSFFTTG